MRAISVADFRTVAVHIGKVIEARIISSGIPISKAAKALRTSRTTLYTWFAKSSWDSEALLLCSRLLKEDLFQIYSQELRSSMPSMSVVSEPQAAYQRAQPSSVEITIKSTGSSGEIIERIMKAVEGGGTPESSTSRTTVTRKPRRSR